MNFQGILFQICIIILFISTRPKIKIIPLVGTVPLLLVLAIQHQFSDKFI